MLLNLDQFITEHVTGRAKSLFQNDIDANKELLAKRINGKSALVIGGAGTIGSSFIKAVLKQGRLSRLYVVDTNENGLTELTRDVRSSTDLNVPETFITYPVNFGDTVFKKIWEREGPFDIVTNFAAHKHVRSEKDHYSIEAMVDNNVLKAKQLLELISQTPPAHFFCVSTDKAANPVNIMGASKKLMEEVILAYSQKFPITTARFANVAFSNGSLPFGFLERLKKRQPLSAPLDIKRFFVSPKESGEICMLACLLGESGDIFFPKLDPGRDMQTFTHIGDQLLRSLGFNPQLCQTEVEARELAASLTDSNKSYPVYYFKSDTSGEKPFEEFYTEAEQIDVHRFEALGVIQNSTKRHLGDIEIIFEDLHQLFYSDRLDKKMVVQLFSKLIPTFEHVETGKSLDQKM
ncbi:MAG: polysaccharide biosynthesis protein [Bacteroidota bacterium]